MTMPVRPEPPAQWTRQFWPYKVSFNHILLSIHRYLFLSCYYLRQVVSQIQDVVDQVSGRWDLEIRDSAVVDGQATLVPVEVEESVHPGILLELLLLREHTDDLQICLLYTSPSPRD